MYNTSSLNTAACGDSVGVQSESAAFVNGHLAQRYETIRAATVKLAEPLSPEDCSGQSMRDASPTKWHLAHTSWFFETFILERKIAGYRHFHPKYRILFNSYYNTVGKQHPRARRGFITRPSLKEVHAYREHVDHHMQAYMENYELTEAVAEVIELGLQHEQQHQELILTDVKHLFSFNPLYPTYQDCARTAPDNATRMTWHRFPEGTQWIGHNGSGFAFDNEHPRHREHVESFQLASRPVTNAEFLEFMQDDGYEQPELWLSDAWDTLRANKWWAPLYWEKREGHWFSLTLSGLCELRMQDPVCHVSYYEADAFARWAGARLPTESEWEVAARNAPREGNFVEESLFHPIAAETNVATYPRQLFGDVWEWTQSPYGPYPGYCAPEGALGEYNGKFMCNQYVLRGGSCVTPKSHIRSTYRNFFPPDARWQFSGVRLARDV